MKYMNFTCQLHFSLTWVCFSESYNTCEKEEKTATSPYLQERKIRQVAALNCNASYLGGDNSNQVTNMPAESTIRMLLSMVDRQFLGLDLPPDSP